MSWLFAVSRRSNKNNLILSQFEMLRDCILAPFICKFVPTKTEYVRLDTFFLHFEADGKMFQCSRASESEVNTQIRHGSILSATVVQHGVKGNCICIWTIIYVNVNYALLVLISLVVLNSHS